MKAIYKKVRISPKKVNLIASMVRECHATKALDTLHMLPKKGARILHHVLKSAVSNAENNFSQNVDDLYIKKILVTKGPTYTRYIPISRGRVHPVSKRTSHILIEVGLQEKISQKEKKAEKVKNK